MVSKIIRKEVMPATKMYKNNSRISSNIKVVAR